MQMKIGKISESVLKRSVLKEIKSKHESVKNGAGVGSDCAIFTCGDTFTAVCTQMAEIKSSEDVRCVMMKAAGGVACSGAQPVMATLALLLPLYIKEEDLKSHMAEADAAAAELHIQIAGGHTEVSREAMRPCVTVTVVGKAVSPILSGGARPGQDVVISKWIGLEGTVRLAARLRDELVERYPLSMIEKAIDFKQYLSIIPEAATAAKSNVSAMHDVSGGGIFAALWEIAESAGVGLSVDLKKIPVRQETIEICEFFGLNPYELSSGGSLLMTADNGESLVQALEAVQIPATVIGKITDNNDKIVVNEDEKRFLERPKADEINKKM